MNKKKLQKFYCTITFRKSLNIIACNRAFLNISIIRNLRIVTKLPLKNIQRYVLSKFCISSIKSIKTTFKTFQMTFHKQAYSTPLTNCLYTIHLWNLSLISTILRCLLLNIPHYTHVICVYKSASYYSME